MCEFCTEHGEGKKWYLQMGNYAEELLHEQLSRKQKDIVHATTRLEWTNRFWQNFVVPAITGVPMAQGNKLFVAETPADRNWASSLMHLHLSKCLTKRKRRTSFVNTTKRG